MPDLPDTIAKYELAKEIGRGSMGVVHLAHDPFTERDVAIKVALPEALRDETTGARYRKMFFNEAKVAGLLRHPNIVSVYDAGVQDEICYIVMEYVPGSQTLGDFCQRGSLLDIEQVVRMSFKCARALDYAHRRGVVHRDIKPRNIMLAGQSEVKLCDFSTALILNPDGRETQVQGYVGSPMYMSPEQILEERITAQSDVFSLGLVMYQLLSGFHPFVADTLAELVTNISTKRQAPLSSLRADVPQILLHIVDRALEKDPEQRYRSALDVAADLSLVFEHAELFKEEISGEEKFKMVRRLAFFKEFDESEIWELIKASLWKDFNAGERILVEGEADTAFYIIVDGDVSVRKGGRELNTLEAGDCFGEMAFIANQRRTASIWAESGVSVLKVRSSVIERATANCQLRFHKVFLRTLVERLGRANERIAGSSQRTRRARRSERQP
ncbi:MAG: protein kinase domain-containing protein [Gammaproteobacteria bacterium]